MFEKSRIEKGLYWDRAWSLISGCTPCSPGCDHCWSAEMTYRFEHHDIFLPRQLTNSERQFSGRISIHPERLDIPLKRKKPTVWAIWNDLFHSDVPNEFLGQAFYIMEKCPQHVFLVLTKRAKGMADYLDGYKVVPHIWLGVTICNQPEADEKIPRLLQIPAAVRWISIEPMLEPVDINLALTKGIGTIQWVVCGGESGPGARPMMPQWALSVKDQCVAASIPFFFKNHGSYYKLGKKTSRLLDGREWRELPEIK